MDNLWIWLVVDEPPLWKKLEFLNWMIIPFPTKWNKKKQFRFQTTNQYSSISDTTYNSPRELSQLSYRKQVKIPIDTIDVYPIISINYISLYMIFFPKVDTLIYYCKHPLTTYNRVLFDYKVSINILSCIYPLQCGPPSYKSVDEPHEYSSCFCIISHAYWS